MSFDCEIKALHLVAEANCALRIPSDKHLANESLTQRAIKSKHDSSCEREVGHTSILGHPETNGTPGE
jgi:hypothetical protein